MNETNTIEKTETKLHHGQLVRVDGFKNWNNIEIFTLAGFSVDTGQNPDEVIARANKNGHSTNPAALKEPSVISADYQGKGAELEAAEAARAAAPMISDGDVVEIDGAEFRVNVMGERFSDPVHFLPV